MSAEKTLWGIPAIESSEMPKGEVILGPLPTAEDIARHGSLKKAIWHLRHRYAKCVMDDEVLAADVIE